MSETPAVQISALTGEEAAARAAEVVSVYGAVFSQAPYHEPPEVIEAFGQVFQRHVRRAGLRFLAALEPGGSLSGFAYGYTSRPGQWWLDVVARMLRETLDCETAESWLADPFEFVELAVLPHARGRGLGAALHDALLADLPHSAALLSTLQAETVALGLYRRRGWQTLLEQVWFPDTPQPYQIMGLRLRGTLPSHREPRASDDTGWKEAHP